MGLFVEMNRWPDMNLVLFAILADSSRRSNV